MKIELPVALNAEAGWDFNVEACVRIRFGTHEIACIPHDLWQPDEDDISRIAGEWLAERLGLKP